MEFPKREPDILRFANDLARGLEANREVFPSPPGGAEALDAAIRVCVAAREAAIGSSARATQDTAAKVAAFGALKELMWGDVRYSEGVTYNDEGLLQRIGWGVRRSRTPSEAPGQVGVLEVVREGKTWVTLGWESPDDGGAVLAYKIQRRKRDTGDWMDVGMAVEEVVTLNGQEPNVEFEYQVIAVNKAGESPASNIVRAVL